MKTFDGYKKRNLTDKDYALLAGGGHKALDTLFSALSSDTTNAIKITVGGTEKSITTSTLKTSLGLGSNAYTSTAYLPLAGGTMTGLLTTTSGSSHNGIKVGNTYINAINGNLIFQNNSAIRFGGDSWDYDVWAGLKYVHSSKTIYLGLADGSAFTAISVQSNGKLYLPGIDNIYTGNGTNLVWHKGNDGSGSGLDADLLDGIHANGLFTAFSNAGSLTTRITIGGVTKDLKIDADTIDGLHANSFVRSYNSSEISGNLKGNYIGMSTSSGITSDWWHILCGTWNDEFRWNSLLALPTLNRRGLYYRSGLDNNTAFGSWIRVADADGTGASGTWNINISGNANTVDNIHATGFYDGKVCRILGSNAPFQAVVDIMKDTSKLNDGGLAFYSYAGDEYTVLIGSRNDVARHGNALKWGYANKYLWMIRMTNGSPKSSDWEKISAGYADSAGNADTVDGLHVHSGRNNEANKIVRTDASGYILAGWINTTSGDMGTTAATRVYCSNDAYIRYKTISNFRTDLVSGLYWANIKVSTSSSTSTLPTFNTCYTSNWFRSTGATGWYSETYGGGWRMTDTTYIRVYGSKRVYNDNTSQYAFYTSGGMTALGHIWSSSSAQTWLNGQKAETAALNIAASSDTGSYWPWFRQTLTAAKKWISVGTLSTNLYFIGSTTSRTANSYDYGFVMNFSNGTFSSPGNIYASHFYENSDIRYKKILNNLLINSYTIANLPLFDFEWIENNSIGTGTSAQAVQEILPNLVSGTDKLTLDYGVLGTIAGITACKELVTLKSELLQLKEKVKLLEDKLRKYENTL